jgi:hypothetical protein
MPTPIERIPHQGRIKPKAIDILDQQSDIEVVSPKASREQAKEVIKDFDHQEQKARQS